MATRRVTGYKLGTKLCLAVGINPDNVRSIRIDAAYDDVAIITVDMIADEDQAEAISNVLSEAIDAGGLSEQEIREQYQRDNRYRHT